MPKTFNDVEKHSKTASRSKNLIHRLSADEALVAIIVRPVPHTPV